ncbi:MAG: paraquat-inducible protein A [Phycisphaerales bacterium]
MPQTQAIPANPASSRIPCRFCGLVQSVPELRERESARCARCAATLSRRAPRSVDRTLALALAGLVLFIPANAYAILTFSVVGRSNANQLLTGVGGLLENGAYIVGALVLLASVLAPLGRLVLAVAILLPVRLGRPDLSSARLQHLHDELATWAMLDVYLLAIVVAYAKLTNFGQSSLQAGWYPLLGLILIFILLSFTYDPDALRRARATHARAHARPIRRARLQTTGALLVAAAIMFPLAYTLPVLQLVEYGEVQQDTVYGAVREFTEGGQYVLAILMFFASILIPGIKLLLMGWITLTAHFRWKRMKPARFATYRVVESIGRWSFIDLFVVSILIALAELGVFASAQPGPGLVFFAGVIVLTMLAALSFDPRLIWNEREP